MSKGAGFEQQREKSELETLRTEVKNLKLQLSGATDEALHRKLDSVMPRVEQLEKENAGLKKGLAELQKNKTSNESAITQLKKENKALAALADKFDELQKEAKDAPDETPTPKDPRVVVDPKGK